MSDMNETVLDAAQESHDVTVDEHDNLPKEAPIASGLEPVGTFAQKVTDLDQNSTLVATKTPQALPRASEPNAVVPPGTHAAIVNPATGLSHNPFTWFHLHVLSKIGELLPFVAATASKTAYVVSESESSPTFAAAQAKLISSAVALSASASIAVAEKGLNPTQDAATISLLESLVSAVHTYVGILEAEYTDAKSSEEVPASN